MPSLLYYPVPVQAVLSEGGVPQRPVVFVSRPALMNRVREKLYRLQKEPGWVTVFGMAGSGKSVLAAEAVRDHALITGRWLRGEVFPRYRSRISFLPQS